MEDSGGEVVATIGFESEENSEVFQEMASLAKPDLFPESIYVYTIGLEQAGDRDVWEYAQRHGFTIIARDNNYCNRNNIAIASLQTFQALNNNPNIGILK